MNYILYDGNSRGSLLPFTHTRPVSGLRVGILSIRETWERLLGASCSCLSAQHLRHKYRCAPGPENILINASLLPDRSLAGRIAGLRPGTALVKGTTFLAAGMNEEEVGRLAHNMAAVRVADWQGSLEEWPGAISMIRYPEDIFTLNAAALLLDYELLTQGRYSALPTTSNRILGNDLFLEPGVEMDCVNINTRTGPVYIGKGAVIMEGVSLRGPVAVCEGAVVKMGAKIYGPTTIGPGCVAGGEIKQSVLWGNSNKAHDGYLGNSVIGEWCNLGADTNCSNMKNNYKSVKLWDYDSGGMRDTGLPYCGLMMGDYSRTGINTMFNTGSTVGVNVNIYGATMPPVFVPDFSWGGADNLQTYLLEKSLEAARHIKRQKGALFTDEDAEIHTAIFKETAKYREDAGLSRPGGSDN